MGKKSRKLQNRLFREFESYRQFSLIGESAILNDFTRLGIQCYLPFGDLERTDIIVSFNGILKRIQIKSVYSIMDGCIIVDLRSHNESQDYKYNSNDINYFGIYSYENDRTYLIPISDVECQGNVNLRVFPTHNNRCYKSIKWADEFILNKVANEILCSTCKK